MIGLNCGQRKGVYPFLPSFRINFLMWLYCVHKTLKMARRYQEKLFIVRTLPLRSTS